MKSQNRHQKHAGRKAFGSSSQREEKQTSLRRHANQAPKRQQSLKLPENSTARVRDIAENGDGIALLSTGEASLDGRIIFIPGAVPEDLVRVRTLIQESKRLTAEDFVIAEASPLRTEPKCEIFETCGGCSLQQLCYEETLRFKRKRIVDLLTRIGHVEGAESLVKPLIGIKDPARFRGRAGLKMKLFPQQPRGHRVLIGFYERQSHHIAQTDDCLIQPVAFNELRRALQAGLEEILEKQPGSAELLRGLSDLTLRQNIPGTELLMVLTFNRRADEKAVRALLKPLAEKLQASRQEALHVLLELPQSKNKSRLASLVGEPFLEERVGDISYRLSPLAFSQTNLILDEKLFEEAMRAAVPALRNCPEPKILELYCGSGVFSLMLGKAFPKALIRGIEIVPEAVDDANENARRNGLADQGRVQFICGDAGLALKTEDYRTADLLLVDPPRQGLDPKLCEDILSTDIPSIVYVSCNPATLARDIALLSEGYELKTVQGLDMFPWSMHVESVVLMTKVRQ